MSIEGYNDESNYYPPSRQNGVSTASVRDDAAPTHADACIESAVNGACKHDAAETPRGNLGCGAPLMGKTCLERKVNSPCGNCRAWLVLKGAASNPAGATARPWRLSAARTAIVGDDDTKVADCDIGWHKDTASAGANAALIVQAVNSFDALRAALQTCKTLLAGSRMGGQNHAEQNAYEQVCDALVLTDGGR